MNVEGPNPFQTPQTIETTVPDFAPQRPRTPTSVTVFGVLQLVFGIMGICCLGFGTIGLMVPIVAPDLLAGQAVSPALELLQENMFYAVYTFAAMFLGFVFTIVQIIAGVGLLKCREYGRRLSIYYCYYCFVMVILGLIVSGIYLFPILIGMMQGPRAGDAIVELVSQLVGLLVTVAYAGITIYFMTRPHVIEATHRNG